MKIAVICNYKLMPERVGGMDYFFEAFQKKCFDNNIEVHWYFPNNSNHFGYDNFFIHSSQGSDVATFFFKINSKIKEDYQFIFTHFVELCTPIFKKIKTISNAKIIAVDHNPRPIGGYPLKKKIEKRLKGLLYSKYIDTFVGVSIYTHKEIIKDFGKLISFKTFVIYNGIKLDEINFKKDTISTTTPRFLVASHLRESKGIYDLLDSILLLNEDIRSKLKIDIYGEGELFDSIYDWIKTNHLTEQIVMKGSVNNLKQLYADYDYLLQPTHMECFSLSILESLAANVPVITTPVGGNLEVVSDTKNGFVFPAKNIQALHQIIEKILLNQISISEGTRPLIAKHYSLEKMVSSYFDLLK